MSQYKLFPMRFNLQLFAEGGGGDGGTGADGANGVSVGVPSQQSNKADKNPLASVKYGKQTESEVDQPAIGRAKLHDADGNVAVTVDRNAEFEKLIKGEYKDLYGAKVQNAVQGRVKGMKEVVDKYNALIPTLEMLGQKYGCDYADAEALNKAIQDDDSYYEQEALEKGISVEQLKEVKKIERENTELKRQMDSRKQAEEADRIYAGWLDQAEKAKMKFPNLDLNSEIQNPQFANLLRHGVDVETAFTVIHKDEIIPAAMQAAVKNTEQKMTNKIIANGARPIENGVSSQASAVVKSDVSQLSKADRAEINRRVERGEKIRF